MKKLLFTILALSLPCAAQVTYQPVTRNANAASGQGTCLVGTSWQSCFQPTGSINLLGFTKSDAGSVLTVAYPSVTATNITQASSFYLVQDFGANFFDGNLVAQGRFTMTAESGNQSVIYIGGFSSALGNLGSTGNSVEVQVNGGTAGPVTIYLTEFNSGVAHDTVFATNLSLNTPYYWVLSRSGATVTLSVYTDALHTQSVSAPVSLTLNQNVNYRYFYAVCGYAGAGTQTMTITADQFSIVQQ